MINDKNYKNVLSGFSIIEITGDSCISCISMMPIITQIAENKNIGLYFVEANMDSKEIIETYNVNSVPTILLLHNLELIGMVKGYQPQEILELWIDSKIEGYLK